MWLTGGDEWISKVLKKMSVLLSNQHIPIVIFLHILVAWLCVYEKKSLIFQK